MDIRQSYEKINISEQAKNQIKNDILAGEKTVRKENGSGAYKKYGKLRWLPHWRWFLLCLRG